MGEKILVGTNAGEVFEVLATDKDKPKTIVQVCIQQKLFTHLRLGFFFREKLRYTCSLSQGGNLEL